MKLSQLDLNGKSREELTGARGSGIGNERQEPGNRELFEPHLSQGTLPDSGPSPNLDLRHTNSGHHLREENRGIGRPPDSPNVASQTRLEEVARLAVQGCTSGEIAEELRVTVVRASQLMKQAREENIIAELSFGRDEYTKKMEDKMRKIADSSVEIIQARLNKIRGKLVSPDIDEFGNELDALDARAMNDAFRSFDKSDVIVGSKSKNGNGNGNQGTGGVTNIFALFGNDALEKAKETSNRIFER